LFKLSSFAAAAALVSVFAFPTSAATAACVNPVIWTQDGDSSEIKKWSTEGVLLETLEIPGGITTADIAITSDLSQFLAPAGDQLLFWDSSSGEPLETQTISGYEIWGAGAGVIAGGKLLADDWYMIYSIDLTTFVATEFADLRDADVSVPEGLRGGDWTVAGDLLQLPDGDILAVTSNSSVFSGGVLLVRIDKENPGTVTVVGTVGVDSDVWGAARAGDDVFLATADGSLLKLLSLPTSASLDVVDTIEIVSDGGSFWGAAGSNDSTEGSGVCVTANPAPVAAAPAATTPSELAKTGLDSSTLWGLVAASILALGISAWLLGSRRGHKV
jgi:LPXTG-motif cell wall-anchored protein